MSEEHPLIGAYRAFSPRSEALARRAQAVFPGGDTRASAHFEPYPLAIESASGCRMTDVDGHELLDFMNNFTSLLHGHAHPQVVAAVQAQAAKGTAYAAPSAEQIELAELITARVPSIEQMRFTSSGTEGTLMALRCARAATGRQKVMKMEGGYHGSYELAEVSLVPLPDARGPLDAPASQPVDGSFPDSVLSDAVICPYNQPELAQRLIAKHAHELAAVIVEPVLGSLGMVPATAGFLQALREATREHGIVLIFDEVITLRLSEGGAQAALGVTPDLTCMGKIIGGGLPVGGFGGSEKLMRRFHPQEERPVMHASTFSGNALTMAAGLASMRIYRQEDADRINRLGERLREGFNQAFDQAGVAVQMLGAGSLANVVFTAGAVQDSRDSLAAMMAAGHVPRLLHLGMIRRGVISGSRLLYNVSTAMTEQDIEFAVTALNETLQELRPCIEKERPALLAA